MAGENRESKKALLALAVAQGVKINAWARANGVSTGTAYRMSCKPEFRKAVQDIRRRALDRAVGQMTNRSMWAALGISRFAKTAESESVRLKSCRAILAEIVLICRYALLEERMVGFEKKLREANPALWPTAAPEKPRVEEAENSENYHSCSRQFFHVRGLI